MSGHVIALCGGVGGAKLAFGLAEVLAPEDLTIVVNTGDDFVHLGLHVAPDIDTVIYTLAGLSDRNRGWGMAGETWNFMASLRRLGGESWFQLGDQDLAMHVERTRRLAEGESLSQVTTELAQALGLRYAIIPMSDNPVRTVISTDEGDLAFQRYFVEQQCRPVARGVRFEGADAAAISPAFRDALARKDLAAVILCPSNPYLSIDPILAVPGVRAALNGTSAPIIAVSPIIAGEALKGPAAKLMIELGMTPGIEAVAAHYKGLLDGLIVDEVDAAAARGMSDRGIEVLVAKIIMVSDMDRIELARTTLGFSSLLARDHAHRPNSSINPAAPLS